MRDPSFHHSLVNSGMVPFGMTLIVWCRGMKRRVLIEIRIQNEIVQKRAASSLSIKKSPVIPTEAERKEESLIIFPSYIS
jgi:DNA-binding XRE family transcriptional regulator